MVGDLPIVGDFLNKVSFMDVVYAVIIPVFATFAIGNSLPESLSQYSLFAALFVGLLGTALLISIPEYTSVGSIMNLMRTHYKSPKEMRLIADGGDSKIERGTWELDGTTTDFTGIEKIHDGQAAIEREDGTIVGALSVNGMNLDTATDGQVQNATRTFANFLNSSLDFPLQFYLTTRQFDPSDFLEKYEDRLDTAPAQENPLLELYINHYIQETAQFLSQHYYRDYYIIVPVSKGDVQRKTSSDSLLNVEIIPGIGDLLSLALGARENDYIVDGQITQRQIDELDKRLEKIKNTGIDPLGGASAERVDSNEFAAVVKEFWEGRSMSHKAKQDFVRGSPLVAGGTDLDKIEDAQIGDDEQ